MLTDRDVAMAAYTSGARLRDVPVASAMAHEVRSCSTTAPIGEIESLMQSARIRRVPVVDSEGRLLGIVTLGDLARVTQASPLRMAAIPGVARTLASVTERRRPAVAAAAQ
jgi:CBS-domain-containing membrane protein